MGQTTLVLRLAGPLQSWGVNSQFNRRDTGLTPSKSGVIGLLAASQGRPRDADISDLVGLRMGVRIDAPGSILRDYHTVSDYRGRPLLSAAVLGSGQQKSTTPAKYTHVTQRYYLQDAAFLAAVEGPTGLLEGLAAALRRPAFPLALGRRACVPAQPLIVTADGADLWPISVEEALERAEWQVSQYFRRRSQVGGGTMSTVRLATSIESSDADELGDLVTDVPMSFDPQGRGFITRRVRHGWVEVPTGFPETRTSVNSHDPFELLGW